MKCNLVLQCGAAATIAGLSIGAADSAKAQNDATAVDTENGTPIIIVQAQRREENVQDVPIAVTAFNQEILEQSAIEDIRDFAGRSPGLVVDNVGAGPSAAAISIRGISFEDIEKSFDPAVGVSVDGVIIGTNTGQLLDAFDIESIEILRGPQGTLFGRNTIAGVINLRRTAPTGELGVKASLSYAEFDTLRGRAIVNLPQIGDFLSLKGFFSYDRTDGFLFNATQNRRAGENKIWSGGVTALIEPSDSISARITYEHLEQRGETVTASTSRSGAGGDLICNAPIFAPPNECNRGTRDRSVYTIFQNITTPLSYDADSITGELNVDIGDLTLTSVTGWQKSDEDVISDFDSSSIDFFSTQRIQEYDQFSQELRLSGNLSDRIDFVLGLYYFESEYTLLQRSNFGFTSPGPVVLRADVAHESESYAAFADVRWQATDRLTLGGGLRYTDDKKSIFNNFGQPDVLVQLSIPNWNGECVGVVGFLPSPPLPPGLPAYASADNCSGSASFDKVTWRAYASYELGDNRLVYGSVSTGFRSGGFNGRASSPTSLGPYQPETVTAYEIGLKADWLDRALRTNLALFQTDYNNKQEETVQPSPPGSANPQETVVSNAASARIRGFEAEITVVPSAELSFFASLSILDAEYQSFFRDVTGDLIPDDVSTLDLRRSPNVTWSAGFNWEKPVRDGIFRLNPVFRFTDEYNTCIVAAQPAIVGAIINDPRCETDSREILDVTASYSFDIGDGELKFSAFARNLLNDRGISSTLPVASLLTFSGVRAPRQFGGEILFKF